MRLYLAGPMRGYPLYNFPAFDAGAAALRAMGHAVISPAELDRATGFDEHSTDPLPDNFVEEAMRRDVEALLHVDGVAFLPGWARSTGARFELAVAQQLGLLTFTLGSDWSGKDELYPLTTAAAESLISAVERVGRKRTQHTKAERQAATRVAGWLTENAGPDIGTATHSAAIDTTNLGEVRVTDASGGQKGSKLARFDMIPPDVLWELAEHFGFGERKYPSDPETGEANWQKGYRWSLSSAALQRHLSAWLQGEDTDPEVGDSHLIAVAWHAFALRWFQLHERGTDDRRPWLSEAS